MASKNKASNTEKDEKGRFELVVESAPHGIIVAEESGRIILVNRMAEAMFGYPREEFLELKIEDLVPPRIRGLHRDNRRGFHRSPEERQMGAGRDLCAMRKDGSELPVEIGLTPLPDSQILCTVVDITERKRAEDELLSKAKELERSNAELESFASVASHDLQEPLRKIRTMGGRLASIAEGELSDKGRDYLDRMINASERMHQLILDLLTFSRVSTRVEPFKMTDLNEPVSDALSTLDIAIEESGGQVEVGDLPSAEVDVSQMGQLFQNLIGNALKFTREGELPRVRVSGREREDDTVEILVKDEGIGFDDQFSDRIFSIFQRLHGRGEYEGTGVGLAICKKIVDRHHGTIEASSQPGAGAEFRLVLPRKQKKKQ